MACPLFAVRYLPSKAAKHRWYQQGVAQPYPAFLQLVFLHPVFLNKTKQERKP